MGDAEQGQLFISLRECKNIPPEKSERQEAQPDDNAELILYEGGEAFAVLQLENQQIQTRSVKKSKENDQQYEAWDEGYTFDVTNTELQLYVTLYAVSYTEDSKTIQDLSNDQSALKKLGYLLIPISSVIHQKPIDQWFKLRYPEMDPELTSPQLSLSSHRPSPEVHLKIQYTSTSKKVGLKDFQLLKTVGRGAFGKVMMVKKKDSNRLYAMKVMSKEYIVSTGVVAHILSEKNVLRRLNNPFVVSLKYSFQTEDKLYMIMDYVCGGELFFHLCESKRFTEDRAKFYAAEILLALEYVHGLKIVYRDLKPENLLLDMNGHVCLTDFGMCKEDLGVGNTTHTFCGSPEYLAPEILLGKGYDFAVDWWAYGTLVYEMLCGMPPFYSENNREMNQRIVFEKLTFPPYFSPEARTLISGLLERDPVKRMGANKDGVKGLKSHPFFKNIDWDKLVKKMVQPPFRPNLKSEMDVRFFDPDSTNEKAAYSFSESNLTSQQQQAFEGFSYVAPAVEDMMEERRNRGQTNEFLRSSLTIRTPSEVQKKNTLLQEQMAKLALNKDSKYSTS
ncbi:hypothetical protein PROFUN_00893 [Planoprotostelium fungivorum]|uniref:non-specific serine/threonine protein kinase n=1 Tax=Planoprotostelium fungivorum TaxID=1890364 RepID=A0A2P6P0C1_9EUKA|nr:hypothetical protein PROFUN_00893 [Planoprotostelium fungivorum]